VASYALGWLGIALCTVNADPFLAGSTSAEERTHVFSLQAALWPLAGVAGSLLGGLLPGVFATGLAPSPDHPAPYRYPLLIAGLGADPGSSSVAGHTGDGHSVHTGGRCV
jgi:MFS family permease